MSKASEMQIYSRVNHKHVRMVCVNQNAYLSTEARCNYNNCDHYPLSCLLPKRDVSEIGTYSRWMEQNIKEEAEVTLRLTVNNQYVKISSPHSETCDQILLSVRRLLSESCCLVSVGSPL
jgi:hypothetical protein